MRNPKDRTALVCGITGQDGSYLAQLLLSKGYCVWGTSRDPNPVALSNLCALGTANLLRIIPMRPEDQYSVANAVAHCRPDEIYFLAGQSSVGLSFEQPGETIRSIVVGTLNILEACKGFNRPVRLFAAGSGECFGDTRNLPASEETPFNPGSPYAAAKASAYWLVKSYRDAYGLYACTGILFNHESPLRPASFVTRKIASAAKRIAAGSNEKLALGRMDIARDWGWAPEYVEAMWLMLQQENPEDFVIATGETHSLEDFVHASFTALGLDWHDHVYQEPSLFRPSDILVSVANPAKAKSHLGWSARTRMSQVVQMLIDEQPVTSLR
ncbi:MAG: GDP-mannose 4,6-dehydratase [Dechloromonas sp.]|jgi:GDPmannose 4,6-dehydratase|nr:GDP-mannose 4,6-dehydratase [Dechloromonas sp.]